MTSPSGASTFPLSARCSAALSLQKSLSAKFRLKRVRVPEAARYEKSSDPLSSAAGVGHRGSAEMAPCVTSPTRAGLGGACALGLTRWCLIRGAGSVRVLWRPGVRVGIRAYGILVKTWSRTRQIHLDRARGRSGTVEGGKGRGWCCLWDSLPRLLKTCRGS